MNATIVTNVSKKADIETPIARLPSGEKIVRDGWLTSAGEILPAGEQGIRGNDNAAWAIRGIGNGDSERLLR